MPGQAEGHLGWAMYHRAAGEPAAERDHAETRPGCCHEPRQPLALLAAHRALGEIATDTGNYAEASDHLDAALALADACAATYERALTLLALAELHRAEGLQGAAEEALTEARATLTGLQARPALARCDALAARLRDETASPPGVGRRASPLTQPG